MKRLKKKSAGKITLYHATSAQILLKIATDGQILPGGFVGQTSNFYFSRDGGAESPSDQSGVYLFSEDKNNLKSQFSNSSMMRRDADEDKPNFPVVLQLSIDTDALTADYDDSANFLGGNIKDLRSIQENLDKNSDADSYWKKSLESVGHVVHQGPIDVSTIQAVIFSIDVGSITEGDELMWIRINNDDYDNFIEDFFKKNYNITDEGSLSFTSAVSAINALFAEIDNLASDNNSQMTANISSRLRLVRGL